MVRCSWKQVKVKLLSKKASLSISSPHRASQLIKETIFTCGLHSGEVKIQQIFPTSWCWSLSIYFIQSFRLFLAHKPNTEKLFVLFKHMSLFKEIHLTSLKYFLPLFLLLHNKGFMKMYGYCDLHN